MPYRNHGVAWTHPERGPRYSGRVSIRCSVCKRSDDVEQVYGHEFGCGSPLDVADMEVAIWMVRSRLETLGWDCSPDRDPLSADYCPECAQAPSKARH